MNTRRNLNLNEKIMVVGGIQGFVQDVLASEGHRVLIYKKPVDLEARFQPYTPTALSMPLQKKELQPRWDMRSLIKLNYIRLWFSSKNNKSNWRNFDFLRELTIVKNPINFLLIGNKKMIIHALGVAPEDTFTVKNALKSRFPDMEFVLEANPFHEFEKTIQLISKEAYDYDFRDYYTGPEYWRSLMISEDIKSSPLLSMYSTLSSLEEDEIGFYQVLFKPCVYPWTQNIVRLIATEQELIKQGSINLSDNLYYAGFENKEDKTLNPTLAVAIKVGTVCEKTRLEGVLNSLSLMFSNFQFNGERLNFLTKDDYKNIITSVDNLIKILLSGIVFHSGNLFNTKETSGLLHFPTDEILRNKSYKIDKLNGLRVPVWLTGDGVKIGYSNYAGKRTIINQPENVRPNHTAIEGLINQGKSCLIESMFLDDVCSGKGAGLIDPHGDSIDRVIKQIPKERIEDVVYFNPCDDEDFVLCYNPFELGQGEDIGKRVDDLILSTRSLYPAKDWGHVIESTLIAVFYTLLKGKSLTLSDARILLSKTQEGYRLRQSVLPLIDNLEIKMFWIDSFERMSLSTLQRVLNKLSKFLLPEKVNRIFSQRENKINFRRIIDEKKVFLGYLPAGKLGSDCANILGSTIVSAFHNAGMSRQDMPPSKRIPYELYIDECQRISVKSFEDSLRELRKYNVRLTLAYQQREQLSDSIKFALGNVGTMIVLGLDWNNAQGAFREFYGEIQPVEFMRRNTGDGFIKIGNDITSIKTFPPREIKGTGFKNEIIEHSRKHYYTRINKDNLKDTVLIENSKRLKKRDRQVVYDEI